MAISNENGGIVAVGESGDTESVQVAYDINVYALRSEQRILQWPAPYGSQCNSCIGPNELALAESGKDCWPLVTGSDELFDSQDPTVRLDL